MGNKTNATENIKRILMEGVEYLSFSNLLPFSERLLHGFTTRVGGVSKGDFASLNLGLSTRDQDPAIDENYQIFAKAVGIDLENIVCSWQVHGGDVRVLSENDTKTGCEVGEIEKLPAYDAMVTATPGLVLFAFFADCVPVFFYDKVKHIAGIAHSGWKGTVKRISQNVVETLVSHFGSQKEDVIVTIGPSIGGCCFEVGEEVYGIFQREFGVDVFRAKGEHRNLRIDLGQVISHTLLEEGIPERNILLANICTKCHQETFFSHRAQNGNTGRMAAFISLK